MIVKLKNRSKGFSLIEMLISMVIFSVVMGIIYTFLLQTRRDLSDAELELALTDNAQSAVNALRKDLYQIGVGRDAEHEQPQILRAGMFDLIFVADLDREIRNPDRRYGSLDPTLSMSFGPGSPFRPLYFLYDPAIPDDMRYTGWDQDAAYGYRNIGAEIVRYSLDSNSDGVINNLDLEDNLLFEGTRQRTQNPNDFWLFKEWWGCVKTETGYANQHSGVHPVAFNVRGMFYNPQGGVTPESVERFKYPNDEYPPVLFTYWGHFWRTQGLPDPGDPDWPGEPLKLWGDWGNLPDSRVPLIQPAGPGPDGARNGVLDPHEIRNMLNNPYWAEVNLNYMSYITGRAGESEFGDENGNGIPGENRLDQFIRRIGVNILIESSEPTTDRPNLDRSDLSNPNNPVYYYYQDFEISLEINPRNLMYEGSPEFDMDLITPIPTATVTPTPAVTYTPTPGSPTPYIPTVTPTHDPDEPTPTITPTPTAHPVFHPDDGQIFIGGNTSFYGRSIDHHLHDTPQVCWNMDAADYEWTHDSIEAMTSAYLCNPHSSHKDLVIATSASTGASNVFYYQNPPVTGIDVMEKQAEVFVGPIGATITHLAAGNLGEFGGVPSHFDEVVVALRNSDYSQFYLHVLALNNPCDDLMPTPPVGGEDLIPMPQYNLTHGYRVLDMTIADFTGNNKGELAVLLKNHNNGHTKVKIFKNMDDPDIKWGNPMNITIQPEYIPDIQFNASKLVTGVVYSYSPSYPSDLIVVAENGHFVVLKNQDLGQYFHPISPTESETFQALFSSIVDAVVYDANINDQDQYYPVLAIAGLTLMGEPYIAHYNMKDPIDFHPDYKEEASGAVGPSHFGFSNFVYVPVRYQETNQVANYLVSALNLSTQTRLVVIKDPVISQPVSPCQADSSQLIIHNDNVNAITSTRNALTD